MQRYGCPRCPPFPDGANSVTIRGFRPLLTMDASCVVDRLARGVRRVHVPAPPKADTGGWYPIALEFRYRAFRCGTPVHSGDGETAEISSHAVRIRIPTDLPERVDDLELAITWPVALNGVTPLRWMVKVKPIWSAPGWMFASIVSHELRTAGGRGGMAMAACG